MDPCLIFRLILCSIQKCRNIKHNSTQICTMIKQRGLQSTSGDSRFISWHQLQSRDSIVSSSDAIQSTTHSIESIDCKTVEIVKIYDESNLINEPLTRCFKDTKPWRACISTDSTQGCLHFELGRLSASCEWSWESTYECGWIPAKDIKLWRIGINIISSTDIDG